MTPAPRTTHRTVPASRRAGTLVGVGTALVIAGGEIGRVTGVLHPSALFDLAIVAAVALLPVAILRARLLLGHGARVTDSLADLLHRAHGQLDHDRQARRERLHDARSAMVGIVGASRLLLRPSDELTQRDALLELFVAEIERLHGLLDDEATEESRVFELTDALAPVLVSHRAQGTSSRVRLDAVTAYGRPHATATALDNVLRNARLHAPGSQVAVTVRRIAADDTVEIVVDDDGPGIAPAQRHELLRAGARGRLTSVPGTGLGLYNAARAMTEQGGNLALCDSPLGGLRVVLTLPIASACRMALAG